MAQYTRTGVDFLATIYKQNGQFIGRCGMLWQAVDNLASIQVAEKNGMRYERDVEFEGHRCLLYNVGWEESGEDESERYTSTS